MCPEFGEGPASNQVNVFEFDVAWPGSIFRDRNRWVLGNDQPLIQRAFGIHRKLGTQHYGYFGTQFDDYNVVTGAFGAGANTVRIDRLPGGYPQSPSALSQRAPFIRKCPASFVESSNSARSPSL